MATATAAVLAAFFLLMGCAALAAPAKILQPFGIRVDSAPARSEVRAVYGGFGVAMAAVLVVAAVNEGPRTGIMLAVGAALAGMAAGRLISAAVDRRTAFYPVWFYFLIESAAAAALFTWHG